MKFAFYTLGCKTNQYETQAMERLLAQQGHDIASFEDACDGYIINTCSVTAVADKKNRAVLRRCRREHPEAVIGVCGCYSQHAAQTVKELGADVVGGSGGREQFLQDMLTAARTHTYQEHLDNALRRREFEILPPGGLQERTRAMLKVQDGCTNFCTYCIIPYARGAVRSLPADQAAEQARGLAQQGYRELVITGIELSTYGRDLPGRPDLASLIEAVCHAVPEMRVRLGSLEPRTVTEDFCARLAALPNLCPHFHLSLQSGSDTVLARMKRKYTTQRFLESVRLLRTHFDRPALTTDLIVGFPGETEEEFQETLAFLQRCAFAQMHIFPYSRRQGTPAASMPGQLSNAEKASRAHRGAELAQAMERSWLTGWIGQTVPVLFEEEKDGFWRGHTPQYIEVRVKGEHLHNQLRPVTITAAGDSLAYGTVKEEQP